MDIDPKALRSLLDHYDQLLAATERPGQSPVPANQASVALREQFDDHARECCTCQP